MQPITSVAVVETSPSDLKKKMIVLQVQRWVTGTCFWTSSAEAHILFKFSKTSQVHLTELFVSFTNLFSRCSSRLGTDHFGFALPFLLWGVLLVWNSNLSWLFHTILYSNLFDPPPSLQLQANCQSSPINRLVNRLPKHLLEVCEDACTGSSCIARVVSHKKLVRKLAIHLVPTQATLSRLCVIAFWAPVPDWLLQPAASKSKDGPLISNGQFFLTNIILNLPLLLSMPY